MQPPLCAFQDFRIIAEFWPEDQNFLKKDYYHKVVYLLGTEGI